MKMTVTLAAALLLAGPATAQSSHDTHHPAGNPAKAMAADESCPQKMQDMSGNMQQMMQMHQQMMAQMAQMMQMMQTMQQHRGMGMDPPKSTPPSDSKPH